MKKITLGLTVVLFGVQLGCLQASEKGAAASHIDIHFRTNDLSGAFVVRRVDLNMTMGSLKHMLEEQNKGSVFMIGKHLIVESEKDTKLVDFIKERSDLDGLYKFSIRQLYRPVLSGVYDSKERMLSYCRDKYETKDLGDCSGK